MRAWIIAVSLAAACPALAQETVPEAKPDPQAAAGAEPAGQGEDMGTLPETSRLSKPLIGNDGSPVGNLFLTDTPNGVIVQVQIMADKLPAGEHAVHFHEVGDCSDIAAFEKAGEHYNPSNAEHGMLVEGGPHAGDMPNVVIVAGKETDARIFNTMVRMSEGDAPLIDGDGSAFILHAKRDDHRSQPSGDAGDRLACADITGK